jgi:hypothetical protein
VGVWEGRFMQAGVWIVRCRWVFGRSLYVGGGLGRSLCGSGC